MKKKFNYVYIITNKINGKQYIGDHSTDNLNDYYFGSGKTALIPAIKKYGKKNFIKEILEFFNTKQEAFDAQEQYIKQYDTLSPNGYNISPKGGTQCNGGISEETKRKMSLARKNISEETRIKMRIAKRNISEETHQKMRDNHKGFLGLHFSEESKQKISRSLKGKKKPPFSKEHKINISKSKIGKDSSFKGKSHTEETKKKISKSKTGYKYSEERNAKISKSHLGKKLSEQTKEKIKKSWIKRKQLLITCLT